MNDAGFNLSKTLEKDNPEEVVMDIDQYLNRKSEYGDQIEKLTDPQKVLLIVENLQREVNNGGFNQFYWNSSGDFSTETVDALIEISALTTAGIVKRANSQFPDNYVPKDRTERQELMEEIEDKANEEWEKCDDNFFKYEDNISELLLKYVIANRSEFEN